jgi:hypothetical protein
MDKIVENLAHSSKAIHLNEGDIKEFYFKELDYLLDRIKWYDNLRATTLFFSATASITIIGISISNNKSIFMLVPIVILLFFIFFDRRCRKSIISYYCCGYIILDNLKISDQDTVLHIDCNPLSKEGRRIITDYSNLNDRKNAIRKTKVINRGFFFYAPILVLLIEIIGSSIWIIIDIITWAINKFSL